MKKKGSKGLPPISTASLPDVIFMILFFFMVSTTMRDQELLVRYKLPEATEVQKLEKKSLVSFIHIGPPAMTMQAKLLYFRTKSLHLVSKVYITYGTRDSTTILLCIINSRNSK